MAIPLQFIDFIVPRSVIEKRYPGGWVQCLKDHSNLIGGRVWYDDHLFRDGAMSSVGINNLINEWSLLGFDTYRKNEDGLPIEWLDVCVCESLLGKLTLPCEWLVIDWESRTASLNLLKACLG